MQLLDLVLRPYYANTITQYKIKHCFRGVFFFALIFLKFDHKIIIYK